MTEQAERKCPSCGGPMPRRFIAGGAVMCEKCFAEKHPSLYKMFEERRKRKAPK